MKKKNNSREERFGVKRLADSITIDISQGNRQRLGVSSTLIDSFYYYRSLREFFTVLSMKGINTADDISKYSEEELYEISPLNWYQRKKFREAIELSQINLKPA